MILKERINSRLLLTYMVICISVFQTGVDFQLSLFMYYTPKYQCQISNQTGILITADNCFYYHEGPFPDKQECQNWTFDTSQIKSTVVTDLTLICRKRYLQLLLLPLRSIAGIFALFLGILSDIFGRKTLYMICCLLDTITWILIGVIPLSYTSHVILRFTKIFGFGATTIGFVLVSELTPKRYRNFIIINYYSWFSIGMAVSPVYLKYIPAWRMAWMVAAWPMFFYILIPFILLESPKWLMTNNRKEEAVNNLKLLGQCVSDEDEDYNIEYKKDLSKVKECKLFCVSGKLMMRLIVILFTSFSFYLIYQGTSTNLEFAISDIFINAVIMGLVEIPAGIFGYFSNIYIGGVTSVVLWTFIGMLSYAFIPDHWDPSIATSDYGITTRIILASLAKFFMIAAWNVMGMFYVLLFPTNRRNLIANLSDVVGYLGAAVGGFIGYYYRDSGMSTNTTFVANIIYGVMLSIAAIIFGICIPSVHGIDLPNTVEEAANITKENPCCCKKDKYKQDKSENN